MRSLCNQDIENIDHVFKNCYFVKRIWDHIKFNCLRHLLFEGDFFFRLKLCIKTIKLIARFSTYPI